MKQICMDTMITLIYQSRRRNADKVKDICGGIFAAYGLDINIYRSAEKVYKEFMLYAIGRNINKYHRFLHDEIKK